MHLNEVRATIFEMGSLKTLRPDGLNAHFYQKSWDMVRRSVYKMVQKVFIIGRVHDKLNQTLICLIPKAKLPESF